MAQDSMGTILKWGLLAGGAYYLYQVFFNAPAAAAAPVTLSDLSAAVPPPPASPTQSTVTPATPPVSTGGAPPVPVPTLASRLAGAAYGDANLVNGQMNAWQWNYYLVNVLRLTPLSDAQFGVAFPTPASLLTPDQFAAAFQAAGGLSGLGRVTIPVPIPVMSGGRRVIAWASRDLAGSGSPRAALFPAAHPFTVRARALPRA